MLPPVSRAWGTVGGTGTLVSGWCPWGCVSRVVEGTGSPGPGIPPALLGRRQPGCFSSLLGPGSVFPLAQAVSGGTGGSQCPQPLFPSRAGALAPGRSAQAVLVPPGPSLGAAWAVAAAAGSQPWGCWWGRSWCPASPVGAWAPAGLRGAAKTGALPAWVPGWGAELPAPAPQAGAAGPDPGLGSSPCRRRGSGWLGGPCGTGSSGLLCADLPVQAALPGPFPARSAPGSRAWISPLRLLPLLGEAEQRGGNRRFPPAGLPWGRLIAWGRPESHGAESLPLGDAGLGDS